MTAGCVTAPSQHASLDQPLAPETRLRSDASRLTESELGTVHASTTLEALRVLRPEFLRASPRSPTLSGSATVAVYLDGLFAGDIEALQTVPIAAVREIDFVEPAEALVRFGVRCQCAGGALFVTTHLRR